MAALTTSGWVTGPMCPSPSNSMTSTRGSVFVSSRATPRDDAGESFPIMKSTGTSSAAKASSGVGSPSNAPAQPRTLTMELAMGPLRGSGVRAQAPGPIQKSMNHSGCSGGVAGVERGGGSGDGRANAVGLVRRRRLGVQQREQGGFVQSQRANTMRSSERSNERHRGAVRMPDQRKGFSGQSKDRLEERSLVAEPDGPVRWPRGTLARAVRIRGQHAELRRQQFHQRTPLTRIARVRVQADYAATCTGFTEERGRLLHLGCSSIE